MGLKKELQKLNEKLKKLNVMKFDNFVPKSLVQGDAWPIGEARIIEGIISTKLSEDEYVIIFKTLFPPKTIFPTHWHDFPEKCTVLRGVLRDGFNKKNYSVGECVEYAAEVPHSVENTSEEDDLLIEVVFYVSLGSV